MKTTGKNVSDQNRRRRKGNRRSRNGRRQNRRRNVSSELKRRPRKSSAT